VTAYSRSLVALGVALFLVAWPISASASEQDIGAKAGDEAVDVIGEESSGGSEEGRNQASSSGPRDVYLYVPACAGNDPNANASSNGLCQAALLWCTETADSTDILYWRYTAVRSPDGSQTPWVQSGAVCLRPGDVPGTAVPAFTLADFRRLPLPKAGLNVQPASGRTLVSVPTNLYATSRPATFRVTLLGTPVLVRARPTAWTWTYGDGSSRTFSTPGAPYPDLGTAHTWTAPGRRTVTLTTTWSGTYSVAGGPALPVDGTASVVSPSVEIVVVETRAELVADPRE
jgi:hypothetical protein